MKIDSVELESHPIVRIEETLAWRAADNGGRYAQCGQGVIGRDDVVHRLAEVTISNQPTKDAWAPIVVVRFPSDGEYKFVGFRLRMIQSGRLYKKWIPWSDMITVSP